MGKSMHFQGERGATMLEFCGIAIVVLGLLGAFFDLGIGLRNYADLTHVTTRVANEIAVQQNLSNGSASCAVIENAAVTRAAQELKNLNGNEASLFRSQVAFNPQTGLYEITLGGEQQLDCFLCIFVSGVTVRASGTGAIDNPSFQCV